jgi:hypothetical protein
MNRSIHRTAISMCVAIAAYGACANLALAQNAAPDTAPAANKNGAAMQAPADRAAKNRDSDEALLGAPPDYGSNDTPQRNLGDAQRTAILDQQRMTMNGDGQTGQAARPAAGKAQRKTPGAANGAMRVAAQPGRPNAAEGLTPEGATRNAYADPYAGKRAVYRSPW